MAQRSSGGRIRAAFFLIVSAFAALLAVVLIYRLIQGYQRELDEATRPPETIKVVVAKRTLYQGQTLGEPDLEIREFVPAFVPDTVFHALEEVQGRVPKERILQDEYIRKERLADIDAGVGLNALIPTGQRALSLNIFDASSVSGFLNPGNYVDVLVTIQPQQQQLKIDGNAGPTTVTMLQAQKVLAVNNRLGEVDPDGVGRDGQAHQPSVTLALTPTDAERMAHAYSSGSVTLTLRNDVDVTQIVTNGAHVTKILGSTEKVEFTKVVPKKKEKRVLSEEQVLQIYKGTALQTEKIKHK